MPIVDDKKPKPADNNNGADKIKEGKPVLRFNNGMTGIANTSGLEHNDHSTFKI